MSSAICSVLIKTPTEIRAVLKRFLFFSYETTDGEIRDESGEIRLTKTNVPYLFVKGFYSYFTKDNKKLYVIYEADDKGYRQQIYDPEVKHKDVEITSRFSSAALASLVGGGIGK